MSSDDEATHTGSLQDVLAADIQAAKSEASANHAAPGGVDLRLIAPRPVPSIVLSIGETTAAAVAEAIGRIPAQLDEHVARYPVKIELRADKLPGFSERMTAAAVVLRLGVPIIVTLRSRAEGGATTLTEPDRQRFFMSLVSALRGPPPPGSLIDVEAAAVAADPQGWGQVLSQARERGFHLVLSHHDLIGTPDDDHGLLPDEGLLDTVPGGPAALWKAAATVQGWDDELALLSAMRRGNASTRRAAIMGMGSPTSRLLSPFFAAPLVYAAIAGGSETAPGQIPFGDLVRTWHRWGLLVDDEALAAPSDKNGYPPRWMLLGRPAWHSLSPAMHNAAARAAGMTNRYFPLELPPAASGETDEELVHDTLFAMRGLGIVGGNVTVPFKSELAAAADVLDGDAEVLGVANTYRFDNGKLHATNTDTAGTRRALETHDVNIAKASVLVLGAGGSAAAALLGLRDAQRLQVSNRTLGRATKLASDLEKSAQLNVEVVPWDDRMQAAANADVLVNCTTLGMTGGPGPEETPIDAGVLQSTHIVLDLVYVPLETPFMHAAKNAGARTIDGTHVLMHQAIEAFRYWTDQDAPTELMRGALDAAVDIPFPDSVRAIVDAQRDV